VSEPQGGTTRGHAITSGDHGDPAGAVFSALADPTRRTLLQTIADHPAATATELAAALPITRQAVIKHLSALADAGLLDRAREGREVRYSVTPAPLSDAVSWMASVGGQWDDRLAALKRQFDSRS
jgi:DNA-binding transcriptional ArsR family regulator